MSKVTSAIAPSTSRKAQDEHILEFTDQSEKLDASIISLFSSSAGPVKHRNLQTNRTKRLAQSGQTLTKKEEEDERALTEEESSQSSSKSSLERYSETGIGNLPETEKTFSSDSASEGDKGPIASSKEALVIQDRKSVKSRKRKRDNEDLETEYMRKLAKDETREQDKNAESRVLLKATSPTSDRMDYTNGNDENRCDPTEELSPPPLHESLVPGYDSELEKGSRTVFLGNVSTDAIRSKTDRRTLLKHLVSCFTTSAEGDSAPALRVESLRFRSTAFSTPIPKKAAYAKKELMDATTKSTNAYVVYSSKEAALKAAKSLNGTVVLERHLRADSLSNPASVDHRRCVFVGNLGFVDDETRINEAEDGYRKKPRRSNKNGDIEEGLWQQFSKAGTVESVRVVRDAKTRVGKGFAYVQFTDQNGVEAALLFNDKKFPPLLPRKLRVVRAKKQHENYAASSRPTASRKPKSTSKLTGRAASDSDQSLRQGVKRFLRQTDVPSSAALPKKPVFEGHRASANPLGPKHTLKLLGKAGRVRASKPTSRSAKRGTAWKAKMKGNSK